MINSFDYLDSSIVSGIGFGDAIFKTFDNLGEKKENDTAGWLFLISLNKLIKRIGMSSMIKLTIFQKW